MKFPLILISHSVAFIIMTSAPQLRAGIVYSNGFDGDETFSSGVSGSLSFSGFGFVEDGQGLKGLGNAGQLFAGNILRHELDPPGGLGRPEVSLTLNNLPAHTRLSLGFLFAAIDTWDGTDVFAGFPSPDFFNVEIDGALIFHESYRNRDPVVGVGPIGQSYVPPPGGQIPTGSAGALFGDIGFGSAAINPPSINEPDGAYDMYLDPTFQNIAHTASSVTITWFGNGGGNQRFEDESFGLDNLTVSVSSVSDVPEPSSLALLGMGGLTVIGCGWRRQRKWRPPWQSPAAAISR